MRRLTALLLLLVGMVSHAQTLPVDPAVRYGKLDNGLTYYICSNTDNGKQAEFHIVQRVGSILEEDHQRGLAHFLEHMAFNGTKHFPGKQLIDYLESNGVQFGTNINAYTSFDETAYRLTSVPTHRQGMVDSCLLVLRDWSGDISLEAKEIDAERKVIHEEWRTKRNVRDRIYEQTLPVLFPDSNRYAYRMPIGVMEVVDNFSHQALRDYYHRWYRPDLQAIIVCGAVDADYVEQRIRALWSDVIVPAHAPERIYCIVPDNSEPIVAIGTDRELTSGTLRISYKYDPLPAETSLSFEGRRDEYVRSMIVSLLNARIMDMQQTEEFSQSASISFFDGDYSIALTKKALSATATFRADRWQQAMQTIVFQLKRALEHGFTPDEHERMVQQLRVWVQAMERGGYGTTNAAQAKRCMNHFLRHQPLLSTTDEAEVYRRLLSEVTLDDINNYFGQMLYSPGGMAILLQGQEHESYSWPTRQQVLEAYGKGWMQPTTPYEIPIAEPLPELMPQLPEAGSIVSVKYNKQYGTREYLLSNGARVVLKLVEGATSLQFTAISPGGTSLIGDSEYCNINAINALPPMGGLGDLTPRQLARVMENSSASYKVNVGTLAENFSGSCRPADTEQLLQLMHLRFTTMRYDSVAFTRWQQGMRNTLHQRIENPSILSDTLRHTMYEPHPRSRKPTMALADSVDYEHTCALFSERFANAADFTYIFVGQVEPDTLAPLLCRYIASLPANPKTREEANLDALPRLRRGRHVAHPQIPGQQATTVIYNILARQRYTARTNATCAILSEVMNGLCSEALREQEGGTYNVSVTTRISRQPADELTLMFNFNSNPQQAPDLLNRAIALLSQVAQEGPSSEAFDKAKKYLIKRQSSYLGTPTYWMNALTDRVRYADDTLLSAEEALLVVTPRDVQRMARKLIRSRHTTELIASGAQEY